MMAEPDSFTIRRDYWIWFALILTWLVMAVLAILYFCGSTRSTSQSQRRLTFITVNDVYQLEGVAGGIKGGLNRLRTLRTWIEQDGANAILLHAGDFLAPSLTSKVFKGEHMIDVLNPMDGDGAAFD